MSILQAISGSEKKTFQYEKLTFTNFYIFVPKTNALHFRFEGGCGGSHWDICISHFSDTRDDTLIIPFLSLLLIDSILGVSIGSLLFSFLKSTSYTLREDIQST